MAQHDSLLLFDSFSGGGGARWIDSFFLPVQSRRSHSAGLMHRSKHHGGPLPRSVSCICLPSALLTNSTESMAAPSWMRNSSIASFIGGGRSPHQLTAWLIALQIVCFQPPGCSILLACP